jgi:hypothetical protein
MPEKSGPWSQVFLQRPDFYGMEACKMSHSWDWKTFQASESAKGPLAGTEDFSDMGECEKICGWREKFSGISSEIVNPW